MDIAVPKRLGILVFVVLTALAAWLSIDRVDRLGQASSRLREQPFALAGALLDAHDHVFSAQSALHDATIAGDAASMERGLSAVEVHSHRLAQDIAALSQRYQDEPQQLQPLLDVLADWEAMKQQTIALLRDGRMDDAHDLVSTIGENVFRRQHEIMSTYLTTERLHATELRQAAEDAENGAHTTSLLLAVLAGGALSATMLGSTVFTRTHQPLMRLRGAVLALASGDHDFDVPHLDQPGTVGALARAVARLKEGLAERDSAMAALRLSEDRLKAALSIAPVAVYNLDRDLRYTWLYNPQIPIPAEDFIGRDGAEFFEAEGYQRREILYRRVLATGEGIRQELVLRVKGHAEPRHYDQMIAPRWDRDGRIVGLTCATIDVTESVRAKHALEAAMDEATRANRAKARFLSAANHDLRQPFQALRLFFDILDQRLSAPGDRKVLTGALSALAAGEELLRSYLDVTVLESGIVQADVADFPVAEILADVAAECAAAAADKHLELRLVPSSAIVTSDPRLLRNLVRNLVVNAVRYTERGRVLVGCRHTPGGLRIEVWDTGIGIPDDKLVAVFEDFYQLGNGERDRTKGLGLGLSVVDRTARLLGHPVSATSDLGRGSAFTVTVPLAEASRRIAA